MRTLSITTLLCSLLLPTCLSAQDIDSDGLQRLHDAAEAAGSDAVVIIKDGTTIAEWYFDEDQRPIETMSALKSIVALGIGNLLATGAIESLDQPVHHWYPEWNQGKKKEITLRHLLNHTSGLQHHQSAGVEIYPAPDAIKLALAAEVNTSPGSAFSYNNKAVNLLSGIIEKASGQRMDQFFLDAIFEPLGIEEYRWYFDQSGRPHAMAGLRLHATDFAKFGQLVLNDGVWGEKQIVNPDFIESMLSAGQEHYPLCGLLWWRLPNQRFDVFDQQQLDLLRKAGADEAFLRQAEQLLGVRFTSRSERNAAMVELFGQQWPQQMRAALEGTGAFSLFRIEYDEIVAYYGDGFLGQTLLVVPAYNLVAVRQVARDDDYDFETDGFVAFKSLVLDILAQ